MSPKLITDDGVNVFIGYEFDLPMTRYSAATSEKTDEYSDWYGYLLCRGMSIDPAGNSFDNIPSYTHQRMIPELTVYVELPHILKFLLALLRA